MKISATFARAYRWIEYVAFRRGLEQARLRYLHRVAGARRILVLGEGDGRTLQALLRCAPFAAIEVVELNNEMIRLAESRAGNERVHFTQADARNVEWAAKSYDAVITHFLLDCFSQADAEVLARRLGAALVPCGLWLAADFAIPPSGWRRVHAKVWVRTMYWFFRAASGLKVSTLVSTDALISSAGLRLVEAHESRWGLIRSTIWRNCHDGSDDT